MRWRLATFALVLASAARAQENADLAGDEAVLREQNLPTKGADVLRIFRDRTPRPQIEEQFHKSVVRLKAAPYAERVKATTELVNMGPLIRPLLEQELARGKLDAETDARLRQVLERFPPEKDIAVVSAAARLLVRDKPDGSLAVLLNFVPHVTNESVRQEVQRAINAAGFAGKEPAPGLLAALKAEQPARRAAAAEAMVRVLGPAAKAKIEALLKDQEAIVRYQLGLALVEKNDKAGLPLLIGSIADMPEEAVENALDLLYRAAGEKAPTVGYEGKKNAAACRAAWSQWLDKNAADLDLAKQLAKSELGFTVIASTGIAAKAKANMKSQVFELTSGAEPARRWEFDGPRYALDLQIVGPDRLLIAEYLDNRVTERDFKGTILKSYPARTPIGCQRLPNGHTLLVSRQGLQIVDRDGKETFAWNSPPFNVTAAYRMRNGQIAVATTDQRCRLLDPQGRELKSFQLGIIYTLGGGIEVLPNGRVLAALYSQNCVAEFDWNGNKLWQAQVNRNPTSATRLANGNTLVACGMLSPSRVVEIDKAGNEVWSYSVDGRFVRARRR